MKYTVAALFVLVSAQVNAFEMVNIPALNDADGRFYTSGPKPSGTGFSIITAEVTPAQAVIRTLDVNCFELTVANGTGDMHKLAELPDKSYIVMLASKLCGTAL